MFISFKFTNDILFIVENPDLDLRNKEFKHNKSMFLQQGYLSYISLYVHIFPRGVREIKNKSRNKPFTKSGFFGIIFVYKWIVIVFKTS